MQPTSRETNLAERHYVTFIVRLMLDSERRLIQGELVDTTDTFQQRFIGVAGLNEAVRHWLTQHTYAENET